MLRRNVQIFVGEEYADRDRLGRYDHNGALEPVAPDIIAAPTLQLPEHAARALLSALQRHFEGGEETARLRKDYDAERGRVDKLTDAVIDLAKKGPVFIDERR
jgi:hypothetical protein